MNRTLPLSKGSIRFRDPKAALGKGVWVALSGVTLENYTGYEPSLFVTKDQLPKLASLCLDAYMDIAKDPCPPPLVRGTWCKVTRRRVKHAFKHRDLTLGKDVFLCGLHVGRGEPEPIIGARDEAELGLCVDCKDRL